MRVRILLIPLVAVILGIALPAAPSALGQGPPVNVTMPPPTAGTKLVGGLLQPRGMKVGPDGMIYVAESGTGGTTAVGSGDTAAMVGTTGRISKIDPNTGTRTTVADNLPSTAGGPGGGNEAIGPSDVAFIGSQLYYIQSEAGAAHGFPNSPTGLYKVNSNGTVTLVGNIGAFEDAQPSASSANDRDPGGNPYAMTVRDGNFYVTDGNQNRLLKITPTGTVSLVVDWPTDITTTGITFGNGTPFYVSTLGPFPFTPEDGRVYTVGYPSGTLNQVAAGVSSITDVEVAPNGQVYAVNFGDQATDPNGPPWALFSAKLMRVDTAAGKFVPLASGFLFSTSLAFIGDTAYVNSDSINAFGTGEIWKISNVSALQPLPPPTPTAAAPAPVSPAPAATAPSGVTGVAISGPNTGTGPGSADGDTRFWALALVLGVLGVGALGAALATKRA